MTTVLVIEDSYKTRQNIVDILTFEGYSVLDAKNGADGVALAREHLPDVVVCDITMPELDGYGVFQQLRQEEATARIPFIFLTALAAREEVRKGMGIGADDYLTKPFTAEELLGAIAARLDRQQTFAKPFEDLRKQLSRTIPHELRTPLVSVLGYADLLADPEVPFSREETVEIGRSLLQAGRRLERLAANYVLYATLETRGADPEYIDSFGDRAVVDPSDAISSAAEAQATEARRAEDLDIDMPSGSVAVVEELLTKIVSELVDNGFKFSKPGTPVRVVGRYTDDSFILSVVDRGVGMTRQQIADAGAFVQFDREAREQQGSGLGLVIAKRLAELHGGELTVDSMPDRGTTVAVTFPRNA